MKLAAGLALALLSSACSDTAHPPDAYDPDCSNVADEVMAACLLHPSMDPGDSKQPDAGTPEHPGQCRRAAERAYMTCQLEQISEEAARQRQH